MSTPAVRLWIAAAVLALAAAAGWGLHGRTLSAGTGQAELWSIASELHAPGDTTTQTAASSTVLSAWQIRAQIQSLLQKGWGRARILRTLENEYGPTVLADPNIAGFGVLAWLLPGAGVAAGLAVCARTLRRRRAAADAQARPPQAGAGGTGPDADADGRWRSYL